MVMANINNKCQVTGRQQWEVQHQLWLKSACETQLNVSRYRKNPKKGHI
jgi:hypothetical protein